MSSNYKTGEDHILHFVTFTVVEWIDALTRAQYKDIILQSLQYCIENKGLRVHAWVIMPNHLHLIISAIGNYKIFEIVRDMKKFTSKKIIQDILDSNKESRKQWLIYLFKRAGKWNSNNEVYQFWIQDYHPVELYSRKFLIQRLHYLHNNPVKARIVDKPEDYIYSSASEYILGKPGPISIEKLIYFQ